MWPRPGVSKQWVGSYVQAEYLAYSHTHSEYQKSEKQTHFMIRLTLEVGPTLTLCTRPITDSLQHNQSLTPPVLSLPLPVLIPTPPLKRWSGRSQSGSPSSWASGVCCMVCWVSWCASKRSKPQSLIVARAPQTQNPDGYQMLPYEVLPSPLTHPFTLLPPPLITVTVALRVPTLDSNSDEHLLLVVVAESSTTQTDRGQFSSGDALLETAGSSSPSARSCRTRRPTASLLSSAAVPGT